MASRLRWTLVVVVVAVLVATAAPATAATTATASIHTTDSDFSSATTLSNVAIEGTGTSASVAFVSGDPVYESFEDGDIAEYFGDTGSASATTSRSYNGSYSGRLGYDAGSNAIYSTSGLSNYPSRGDGNFTAYWWRTTDFTAQAAFLFGVQDKNNYYGVRAQDGSLELRKDGSTITSTSLSSKPDSEWARFEIDWEADGTITVTVFDGGGNSLGSVQGSDSSYSSGGIGYKAGWFDASDGDVYWDYIHDRKQSTTGTYISASHGVSDPVSGFVDLSLTNADATVVWQGYTGSSWTNVTSNTYTTDGNKSASLSGSYNDYRVRVDFDKTGSSPTAKLHDEGVQVNYVAPSLDDTSASPTGTLDSAEVSLSIDVSDADFGDPGDTVDVQFYVDGSPVGTDTRTSNGTASVMTSIPTGGSHTWHAVATDSVGQSDTSSTFNVDVPSQLTIRSATYPHGKIDTATVEIRFYEDANRDPVIIEREVTDGTVDLTGFPTGTEFVVALNTSDYHARTIVVDSIYNQDNVFLLNESLQYVQNSVTITDRTGDFNPDQSELVVQRAINQSAYDTGGFKWLNVAGDDLGASSQIVVTLQKDQRYRFVVYNERGESRVLGGYTASTNGTIDLKVGDVSFDAPANATGYKWDASINKTATGGAITFEYSDYENNTTSVTVNIIQRENDTTIATKQFTGGPYGELVYVYQLNESQYQNHSYIVKWSAERDDATINGSRAVGGRTNIELPLSDKWIEASYALVAFLLAFGVGAGISAGSGATAVAGWMGVGWYLGIVPPEIGGGVVILAFAVAGWTTVQERNEVIG